MDADPSGSYLASFLVLLFIYALLTAAETAARTLNKNKLRRQAEYEASGSDRLLEFAQTLTDTPSGLRAGLNFIGLLAGALAAAGYHVALRAVILHWLPFLGVALSGVASLLLLTAVAAFFFLFLGVLLPRRMASRDADKTARRLHGMAVAFNGLFLPLARLANWCSLQLLRLFRINPNEEIEQLTEDEIRLLVDVGEEKGAIQETEREMIENVFEFNNLTAADSMTHRTDMWAIWIDDSLDEIVKLIETTGLSRFPVYDEDLDHIIGTVSTRDILLNSQRQHPKHLRDILRKAHFVPESVRTDVLFRNMQQGKFHMAIVVDEYGGTSGLITMEDLLEEIVGNIYDEYDPQERHELEDLGEGRFRVAGSMDIELLNDSLRLELPIDEEYDTIGGMIMGELGTIPEDGSHPEVTVGDVHFKVLEVQDRRIEWAEMNLPRAQGDTTDV